MGGSVLLVEVLGTMQGRILRKPKQYMRTLRGTGKDMPPQDMANQGEYKQPIHNAMLGQPRSVMPGLPQQGTPQEKTEATLQLRRRRQHSIYPPIVRKKLRGRIPRGILQKYPAGARVRGVGGGVYRKGRYFMAKSKEKTKEQRIKSENTRLKGVFKDLDENKKKVVMPLIQKAAFMHVELEELQKVIEEEGCVCEYKNGANQYGTKKSPEVDVYNTMIKNYTAIIKTLAELAPAAQKKKKSGLALLREE